MPRPRKKPAKPNSPALGAFGEATRIAREAAEYTQTDVANEMGYSQTAVVMWEFGQHSPPPEIVFKLERMLQLKPGALSQHLGYVPVDLAGKRPNLTSVLEIIMQDTSLDERSRKAFFDLYKTLRAPEPVRQA